LEKNEKNGKKIWGKLKINSQPAQYFKKINKYNFKKTNIRENTVAK